MTLLLLPVYLYIKTHVGSGIKYFGRTTANPHTYPGSGSDWKKLLRDECSEVTTEIYGVYTDEEKLAQAALQFSEENNIVRDPMWANKRPEPGVVTPWGNTTGIINVNTEMWFPSYSAAALTYAADARNLGSAVRHRTRRWQGDFWIRETELEQVLSEHGSLEAYAAWVKEKTDTPNRRGVPGKLPHGNKKNLRAVECIETGAVFATTGDAALASGLSREAIYYSATRYEAGAKQYKSKLGRRSFTGVGLMKLRPLQLSCKIEL